MISTAALDFLETNLTEGDVRPKLKDLVNDLFKSIPSGVGSKGAIRPKSIRARRSFG